MNDLSHLSPAVMPEPSDQNFFLTLRIPQLVNSKKPKLPLTEDPLAHPSDSKRHMALGVYGRYDGQNKKNDGVHEVQKQDKLVVFFLK